MSNKQDKPMQVQMDNSNIRTGKLEEKYAKLLRQYVVLLRRTGMVEADVLALNGTLVSVGVPDMSITAPLLTTTPLGKTIKNSMLFPGNNNAVEATTATVEEEPPIPEIELMGIELHATGDDKCQEIS